MRNVSRVVGDLLVVAISDGAPVGLELSLDEVPDEAWFFGR